MGDPKGKEAVAADGFYFENLDALRFYAFLSVLLSHAALYLGYSDPMFDRLTRGLLVQGDLGVNFFFVLSGFLITCLLLRETERTGAISLKHFYLRRVLRIWPVYFLVVLAGFCVVPLFDLSFLPFATAVSAAKLPWYLAFLANIDLAFYEAPSAVIAVLWSVSVEEQFYLLWPWTVQRIGAGKLPLVLAGVVLFSIYYRYENAYDDEAVSYFTFSVFSDLAVGCTAGLLLCKVGKVRDFFSELPRAGIMILYGAVFLLAPLRKTVHLFVPEVGCRLWRGIEPVIFAILFSCIILEQVYAKNSPFKAGKLETATFLGRISYGLYAYHMLAILAVLVALHEAGIMVRSPDPLLFLCKIGAVLILTVAVAYASYLAIERPALRLKAKVGYKNV